MRWASDLDVSLDGIFDFAARESGMCGYWYLVEL